MFSGKKVRGPSLEYLRKQRWPLIGYLGVKAIAIVGQNAGGHAQGHGNYRNQYKSHFDHIAVSQYTLVKARHSKYLLSQNFEGINDYGWWTTAHLQIMRRCDGVLMLPNYLSSKGSLNELVDALGLSMPVFYTLPELKEWLSL